MVAEDCRISKLDLMGLTASNLVAEAEQIPQSVLEELAEAYGIGYRSNQLERLKYRRRLLEKVIRHDRIAISQPLQPKDYPVLARFINPKGQWHRTSLDRAFQYQRKLDLKHRPDHFKVGRPNHEQPELMSPCQLYGYCRRHGLETDYDLSLEQLRIRVETHVPIARPTTNALSQVGQVYRNRVRGQALDPKTFRPRSSAEAIVMAALVYERDLYQEPDPRRAYLDLVRGLHSTYRSLTTDFNPYLPRILYRRETLVQLAQAEGLSQAELNTTDLYEQLGHLVLLNSFHPGRVANYRNSETPIELETVAQLEPYQCVSYGTHSDPDQFLVYTYRELEMTFNQYLNFRDPGRRGEEYFETSAIRKLQYLARSPAQPDEPKEHLEVRRRLADCIERIQLLSQEHDQDLQALVRWYHQQPAEVHQQVVKLLWAYHDLGMYMRGWLGPSHEYPLGERRFDDYDRVERRVQDRSLEFEKLVDRNGRLAQRILDLPLFKYHRGDFIRVNSSSEGLTLGQRYRIAQAGNINETVYSCIRMSSNLIVASSYRYLSLLGHRPNYNLDDLVHIS